MTSLALLLLFLILPAPPATPWIVKQPTCRASCFIMPDSLVQCVPPAAKTPPEAVPIECAASQLRDGLRLVIGGYESARAIAPDGLAIFRTSFAGQALLLRLNVKLAVLDTAAIFPVLPKLRSLALLQPPKEPCIFANVSAPLLSHLEFECLGLDRRPFELVLPASNPQLQLKKCALSLRCGACGPRSVAIATTSHHLKLSQRIPTKNCPPTTDKPCPACARFTTTAMPPTTTTLPTTALAATTPSVPPTPRSEPFVRASPAAAVAVDVAKSEAPSRARGGAVARQAALVAALERRLARTQHLLIVILCLTLANSFVLIGLCGYFARRRRFCGQRKDIYAVAKTAAA